MAIPVRPNLLAALVSTFLGCLLAQVAAAAGIPEKAVNLTWKSTDFKTLLEWEPKPVNCVYTVQISSELSDWQNKCFSTTDTECDLTEAMNDVHLVYEARVLSVPQGAIRLEEPPHTNSPLFMPYLDTTLGQPVIQSFEQVGTKLNVTVEDTHTHVRKNGTFLTLRDVFGKDLSYVLFYRKDSSTGRKTAKTDTNEFLIDVDEGESYCFNVQARIPSRKAKQKSPESITVCTDRPKNVLGETLIIVGAVVFVVIIFIIILSVSLYKCRKGRARQKGKENTPLRMA